MAAVLGTLLGDFVMMFAAVAGLAATMQANPLLFSALTLAVMMTHVTVLSLLYQAGLVLVGNRVVARPRALPLARKMATRLGSLALIGFGLKLAANNR
jgi:threonine/homoserine/homoserine lactone efflux protein